MFRRLSPGQMPTAHEWNLLCEIAERAFLLTSDPSSGIEVVRGGGGPLSLRMRSPTARVVQADSGPQLGSLYDGSVLTYDPLADAYTEQEKCWILPVEFIAPPAAPVTLRVYGDDTLTAATVLATDTTLTILDPMAWAGPNTLHGNTSYIALGVWTDNTRPAFEVVKVTGGPSLPPLEQDNHQWTVTVTRAQFATTARQWGVGTLALICSVLTSGCTAAATSLSVDSLNFVGTQAGGFFNAATHPLPFYIVVQDIGSTIPEIMQITGYSGTTTLNVTRGQAGTSAASHLANAIVYLWIPNAGRSPLPTGWPYLNIGNLWGSPPSSPYGVRPAAVCTPASLGSGFSDTSLAWLVPGFNANSLGNQYQTLQIGDQYTGLPTASVVGGLPVYITNDHVATHQNSTVIQPSFLTSGGIPVSSTFGFVTPAPSLLADPTRVCFEVATGLAVYWMHGAVYPFGSGLAAGENVEHVALLPAGLAQCGMVISDAKAILPTSLSFEGAVDPFVSLNFGQWLGDLDKGVFGSLWAGYNVIAGYYATPYSDPAPTYIGQGALIAVASPASINVNTAGNTIVNKGSGYLASDVLTVTGGTLASGGTAATLTVSTVSGGQITAITVSNQGSYVVPPTNPVSVTGGAGTGATFNLAWQAATWPPLTGLTDGRSGHFYAGLLTVNNVQAGQLGVDNYAAGLNAFNTGATASAYGVYLYKPTTISSGTPLNVFVNGQLLAAGTVYDGGVVAKAATDNVGARNPANGIYDASGQLYIGTGPNVSTTAGITNVPALVNGFGFFDVGVLGGDVISINPVGVPASSSAAGMKGEEATDGSFLYVCISTQTGGVPNTWKRIALVAF